MKRMLLAVFSALCFHATAQITVTAATFPAAGDTFRHAFDLAPGGANFLSPPGGSQVWDFSNLGFEETTETVYQNANKGANFSSFPGAELVVISNTGETYYNVTNNKVELMGYSGSDPANLGVNVLAKFGPAIIERRSPLNFFDINQQTSDLTLPFSTEDLPPQFDSLLSNVPGANFVDSIRVRINFQRLSVMDGWGSLKIPNLSTAAQVLREKRQEYTTTSMDVHVGLPAPFGGWFDIATFFPAGGGPFGDFLGIDTTVTYRYQSNIDKEELAVVTVSNDQSTVETVRFKNIDAVTSSPEEDAPGTAGVQAFPNPAVQWVRFDCTNLPSDQYTLKIFNIVGKVVWKDNFNMAGNRSIRVDLDDFKKGTYLYSLVNEEGTIIGTKRLVVVKP
ncbi:MAG: T9SS type A sorting domain-containing protein [Saprospiraceae bacterium]|nr:T9SS type A sorting domain-containing protein [Saprospiraceae bacterium]